MLNLIFAINVLFNTDLHWNRKCHTKFDQGTRKYHRKWSLWLNHMINTYFLQHTNELVEALEMVIYTDNIFLRNSMLLHIYFLNKKKIIISYLIRHFLSQNLWCCFKIIKNECCCLCTLQILLYKQKYTYNQNQYSKTWDIKCQAPLAQMVEYLACIWRLGIQVPLWVKAFSV